MGSNPTSYQDISNVDEDLTQFFLISLRTEPPSRHYELTKLPEPRFVPSKRKRIAKIVLKAKNIERQEQQKYLTKFLTK